MIFWISAVAYSAATRFAWGLSVLPNYVAGDMIVFNDNGHWSWFMDERVIVDPVAGTILAGSVANKLGAGGELRDGNIEVAVYSWLTGSSRQTVLHENLEPDDHDVPSVLIRPDGRYLAVYTTHNVDRLTRWRVSLAPRDGTLWGAERSFDWSKPPASIGENKVTYSNVFHLTVENRTYNFVRAINRDPSFLVSSDFGTNWEFGGKLLTDKNVGYVNAYVKYSSNDADRIDFIATEHHPKDFNNSIYHGYVKDGKTHRSDGTVVDDNIFDGNAPTPTALTTVFAGGGAVNGEAMTRCWTIDLAVVGQPHAIFTCRANDVPDDSNFNDHRFFYARFDGVTWHVHPLAKAGPGLWSWERDYVGGAAVDPQDRNIVYISTPIDPRDDTSLDRYEIFKGVTSDGGDSWKWDPITFNSTADNRRPVVARWNSDRSALLWCRGTIHHSTHYNMQIVGIIEPREGARATTSAR